MFVGFLWQHLFSPLGKLAGRAIYFFKFYIACIDGIKQIVLEWFLILSCFLEQSPT